MDDKRPDEQDYTADFKQQVVEATQAVAEQAAFWQEFWKEWIPGGLRKRKRYRTKGHGARKLSRRSKNKVARIARRANRRPKKKRRN
jgi:hypothetical protein